LQKHIKQFIENTPWTFAKTYAKTWPHEYIVRERVDQRLFDELAEHIDKNGYESHFYQTKQIYFDFDGRTYWHMGNIVNRCPEADTYHRREKEGRLPGFEANPSHPEIPLPPQPWLTSSKFAEALNVAARMFADKTKKGSNIPYISHLLGTCAIALEHGATEDEAIAALLHDTIEDIKPTDEARAAVDHFGKEVLRIVEACSDSDTHPKPPWQERKERYIDRLAREDRSVLLVSASDKLHNARAIVTDLRRYGPSVWERFNAPREKQLWYYRALVTAFRQNPDHIPALVAELDLAVTEMERLAATP
jgi:hypothetical protein